MVIYDLFEALFYVGWLAGSHCRSFNIYPVDLWYGMYFVYCRDVERLFTQPLLRRSGKTLFFSFINFSFCLSSHYIIACIKLLLSCKETKVFDPWALIAKKSKIQLIQYFFLLAAVFLSYNYAEKIIRLKEDGKVTRNTMVYGRSSPKFLIGIKLYSTRKGP